MGRITTRTADRLCQTSLELSAMADAVHQAGHEDVAEAIAHAAQRCSDAGLALEAAIMKYANHALTDNADG